MHGAEILAMVVAPDRTSVGAEPSGCIWVGMRGAALDGALTVAVAPDWRARLNPADFGQALALATADAVQRRTEAWAEQIAPRPPIWPSAGPWGSPPGSAGPPSRSPGSAGSPPRSPDDLDALVRLVIDAYDDLDTVLTEIDQAVAGPTHGRSDDGRICLVVRHGAVTEVRVDQRWLAHAGAEAIGEHAGRALRDAFGAAERAITGPLQRTAALRDLRSYTSYQAPVDRSPTYRSPSDQSPSYGSPSDQSPSDQSPSDQSPSYRSPSYRSPSYRSPSW
jgi:hypothetical protein